MKKNLSLLVLTAIITLTACSTLPTPDPFSNPATPQPGDSGVMPAHPAPAPTAVTIADSALVTVALDNSSALITIRPGVPLAAVRLRLPGGIYSRALNGEGGVLIGADVPTVRAPLPPDSVVEVAASGGDEFVALITVPRP